MSSRQETVALDDGAFDLPVWLPESGHGAGVLLLQEIFGVNAYIRAVAEKLATLGYVVAAPDLFWRLVPSWQAEHDEEGIGASMAKVQEFDVAAGVQDSIAALNHLTALPEVTGKVGVVGFCLGGSLGHLMAARTGIDAVVSLYGSAVPDTLDLVDRITSPVQYHFGGNDPVIPRESVAQVEEAVSGRDHLEIHVQEQAGHAFHNHMSPTHVPEAAERAWQLAVEFLAEHLS